MFWYWFIICIGCFMQGIHSYPNEVVNGRLMGDMYLYEYGTFGETSAWKHKDGFVRVLNPDTNELIHTFVITREFMVNIKFIADVGDQFIVVVEHFMYVEEFGVWHYFPTELILIQKNGYFTESIELEKRVYYSGNIFDVLIIQLEHNGPYYQMDSSLEMSLLERQIDWDVNKTWSCSGRCVVQDEKTDKGLVDSSVYTVLYENLDGIILPFTLTTHPKWIHDKKGMSPYDPIEVSTSGELRINKVLMSSPQLLEIPGIYHIDITGHNGYEFHEVVTIEPKLPGINNNSVIKDSIPLFSNAPLILVNGERVPSGHIITKAGKYRVELEGLHGLSRVYHIELLPSYRGAVPYSIHTKPVTLYVNGTARINGEIIEEQIVLDQSGYYVLELFRENQLYETMQFQLIISPTNT